MGQFLKIPDACRVTGLSTYFLRKGCREGTVPHIMSGRVFYIDVDSLVKQLSERAREGVNGK